MSLYTLILNPGLPTNQKQFLIRNRTNHDIMLKITSTVPKAFEFEANKIVVGSHKYTVVNMTYIEKELSTSQQVTLSLKITCFKKSYYYFRIPVAFSITQTKSSSMYLIVHYYNVAIVNLLIF
uniref:MSP domain-containing protein n=1 Tax=Heterorhabditis bacteriophora TaxID=37862 RepID=A0A1I7X1A7_HETBA